MGHGQRRRPTVLLWGAVVLAVAAVGFALFHSQRSLEQQLEQHGRDVTGTIHAVYVHEEDVTYRLDFRDATDAPRSCRITVPRSHWAGVRDGARIPLRYNTLDPDECVERGLPECAREVGPGDWLVVVVIAGAVILLLNGAAMAFAAYYDRRHERREAARRAGSGPVEARAGSRAVGAPEPDWQNGPL